MAGADGEAASKTLAETKAILFGRVWEDHALLSKALQITPEDDVLSITSAGDNVLCLLLEEPKSIVAIDVNPAQSALLELKIAAIRELEHKEFLTVLGEIPAPADERVDLYRRIKPMLSPAAQEFWDGNIPIIEQQICQCGQIDGKFGRGFLYLPTHVLPEIISDDAIDALFDATTLEEQCKILDQPVFEKVKEAASEFIINSVFECGISAAEQKDATGNVITQRFTQVSRAVPIQNNFYFSLYLRGDRGYNPLTKPDLCSPYLQATNFSKLKRLVDRVKIVTEGLDSYLSKASSEFNKGNLSDVFECCSKEASEKLFSLLADRCRKGGRVAYWNLLGPRAPASETRLQLVDDCCEKLHLTDRVMFYRAFYCSTVL